MAGPARARAAMPGTSPIAAQELETLFRRSRHPLFVSLPREAAQRLGHLDAALYSGHDHIDHGEGRVEVAARMQLLDRHAGRYERVGVGDAFVAERIELAGRHERWL